MIVQKIKSALDIFRYFEPIAFRFSTTQNPNPIWRALWTLTGAIRSQGNLDDALARFREAADIYENLYREKPADRKSIRNAALTYKNIGGIFEEKRDAAAALEFYRKALEIDRKNVEAEPNNVTSQMDLSFSYGSISTALSWSGDKNAALENLQMKRSIQEKVVSDDAKNAFAQSSLGFTYRQIGDIQKDFS